MPRISLTDFVDFVVKAGVPKQTKVRQLKDRGDYEPAFDFWRQMREAIIEFHQGGGQDRKQLDGVMVGVTDRKKLKRYPETLRCYKQWLGKKQYSWFSPPRTDWTEGDLTVKVNPELGLVFNNQRHVVKLYFKDEALTKSKVAVVLALMEEALGKSPGQDVQFSILDIVSKRLYSSGSSPATLRPLLLAEAQAFVTLWKQL